MSAVGPNIHARHPVRRLVLFPFTVALIMVNLL
jgi:hypothetical protein